MRTVGLDVLAYLPPPLLAHLRVVLAGGASHALVAAERWDVFADAFRNGSADVVVVDPCADGVCRAAPLAALLEARLTMPAVIYTPVSPASFQAITELARHSGHHAVHQIVLHRYDDEPRRFLTLLERQPSTSLSVALLERLAPTIGAIPQPLARAVERLVRKPTEFREVGDLARIGRVTVRTAYRHLARAGFFSPRALVVGARLLHAYGLARDPSLSLSSIARRVGYSSPRMLAKHMREVVGATPRTVRRQVRPPEFVALVAAWLTAIPAPTSVADVARRIPLAVGHGTPVGDPGWRGTRRANGRSVVSVEGSEPSSPAAERTLPASNGDATTTSWAASPPLA